MGRNGEDTSPETNEDTEATEGQAAPQLPTLWRAVDKRETSSYLCEVWTSAPDRIGLKRKSKEKT
jgi:hypothetical protein